MSRNYELDLLKSQEKEAFRRKQDAWQKYADARDRANAAHDEMESAWQERCSARDEMNHEFDAMQASRAHHDDVWDEYGRIRDYNNSRIEALRAEADDEHQQMIRCFEEASSEYEYGDKAMAPIYSQEGHDHKDRRDELNSEVSVLIQEIKEAKENAEYRAPKTDSSSFHTAKDEFDRAKEKHEAAQAEFKRYKAERDRLKDEFDSAQADYVRAKERFEQKLAEVKESNRRERERTLDKAGVSYSERRDAKIVKKSDGTTQVYHGGVGKGDGYGHGHTALDQFGNKTYDRGAFEKHGSQNYTDEKTRWDGPHHGVILGKDRDYDVTFSQGMGKKSGQTVIADGHLSKREFHKSHNHYGPDVKYGDGSERIENKGGDRGYYTGPGH